MTGSVLGTEMDLVSARLYRRLKDIFSTTPATGPAWTIADISPLVLAQRAVKEQEEIDTTRQAAAVADAGHQAARQVIAPGVSELTVAAAVETAMRQAGHEGVQPLRDPNAHSAGTWVISGENLTARGGHGLVVTGTGLSSAVLQGPSWRELERGDLVVVDTGPAYAGYTADQSRTFVVGKATKEQQALFAATRAVEDAVFKALRPGIPIADLYPIAEAVVAQGAPPHFAPGSLTLPGFVGHGIGLEIDEPPVLWPRDKGHLQAGLVLAIEIEVSAPEQGMMVKLEDTVVVQSDGYELLTGMPRELIECGD
jgi:Xaa-Pro aminopeptidase